MRGGPQFLDHIRLYIDRDLYFEKIGPGSFQPFRMVHFEASTVSGTANFHYLRLKPGVKLPHPRQVFAKMGLQSVADPTHFDTALGPLQYVNVGLAYKSDGTAEIADDAFRPVWGKEFDDEALQPLPIDNEMWDPLPPTSANLKTYGGIGNWNGCSAFFVKTEGAASRPAYAVSNGHCYQNTLTPSGAKVDLAPPPGGREIWFNCFRPNGEGQPKPVIVKVKRVAYTTMYETDLAVIELDASFNELAARISPLGLEARSPEISEPLSILGFPASLDIDADSRHLTRSRCTAEAIVNIVEGISEIDTDHVYTWNDVVRHRCRAMVGFSGGPTIADKSQGVVAITNTGVSAKATISPGFGQPPIPQKDCSRNRPCEISASGVRTLLEGAVYSANIQTLIACFDSSGTFNVGLATCRLKRP